MQFGDSDNQAYHPVRVVGHVNGSHTVIALPERLHFTDVDGTRYSITGVSLNTPDLRRVCPNSFGEHKERIPIGTKGYLPESTILDLVKRTLPGILKNRARIQNQSTQIIQAEEAIAA